jgi:hypothetical protein
MSASETLFMSCDPKGEKAGRCGDLAFLITAAPSCRGLSWARCSPTGRRENGIQLMPLSIISLRPTLRLKTIKAPFHVG